jgi:hypothetical protein
VPDSSWKPPSGPPNGAPVHPTDAKREIDEAAATAHSHDQHLRSQLAVVAANQVVVGARLVAAATEVDDALGLAKRALGRANESARAGQRADAAKLTGAAQVFAMRVRDARADATEAEAQLAALASQRQQVEGALADNVGRLQAVAAARLPAIGGRKAARSLALVDETVAAISVPTADLVARAEADAHAALVAAGEAADADDDLEVDVDDLEREVDDTGTDEILDELRTELGLPTGGTAAPSGSGDANGAAAEPATGDAAHRAPHASSARS